VFGVPFDCIETVLPGDFSRCFFAVMEGTRALEARGASLVRLRYERGTLYLIPDEGPDLIYVIRRECHGCFD